jgi:hypothetical protein
MIEIDGALHSGSGSIVARWGGQILTVPGCGRA